jgi:hypothetical protein
VLLPGFKLAVFAGKFASGFGYVRRNSGLLRLNAEAGTALLIGADSLTLGQPVQGQI